MGQDDPTLYSAFLMVADIVGFSEHPVGEQIAMVRHLLAGLDAESAGQPPGQRLLISTGDGYILGLPTNAGLNAARGFAELAARQVVHAQGFIGEDGAAMAIRVGLHVGELAPDIDVSQEGQFAVGSGLNWAARVADLAGPSQVLASESFVRLIVERHGARQAGAMFYPKPPDPAFAVWIKHKRMAEVRVLQVGELKDDAPPKLVRAQRIGEHLQQALLILAESIIRGLAHPGEQPDGAARRLVPRLTLWVEMEGCLRPVRPRVLWPKGGAALGTTAWPLRGTARRPVGPLAAAFQGRAPVSMTELPDPDDAMAYERRWLEVDVPSSMVHGFSRRARALMAIPLTVFDEPIGVLCIDVLDPLEGEQESVDGLMEQILMRSSYFLAALLHLRES